jgi:hypothetical protein
MRYREAHEAARRIKEFWAARGHKVRVEVIRNEPRGHDPVVYGLRSDLVNGLPPALAQKKKDETP